MRVVALSADQTEAGFAPLHLRHDAHAVAHRGADTDIRILLAELRQSVDTARDDLDRFDRVLGSAEAISSSVEGVSRVAKLALSTPLIKTVALASGTGRAARRLRGRHDVPEKRRAR